MTEPAGPIPFARGPFEVRIERSHFAVMRDGVRLSMDLYFPVGVDEKLPVIMERTPYDKGVNRTADPAAPITMSSKFHYFASHGYVCAVQDVRGKHESEGQFTVLNHDVEDAHDTFDWFGDQPWFNGKIGMIGCSIPGAAQLKAAQTRHPFLAALILQSAATGHGSAGGTMAKFWRRGGAVALTVAFWAHYHGTKLFYRPSMPLSREEFLNAVDRFRPAPDLGDILAVYTSEEGKGWLRDAFMTLPVVDIPKFMKSLPSDWEDLAGRAPTDPWWDDGNYLEDDTVVDVPALHINSWHDYGVNETLLQYRHFRERSPSANSRDNQFVIISPLSHCNCESVSERTMSGDRCVGDARFDFWGTYLGWYDYLLKGMDNGFADRPRIQYYVPGLDCWKSADTWPLPAAETRRLYLSSDSSANTLHGSGRLSFEPPVRRSVDRYTYDPAAPIYNFGREVLLGSFNLTDELGRQDVLVYTSEPLEAGIEITGSMRARVHLSADVLDTDLAVKIFDVDLEGRSLALQQGYLRLRYREGFDREVMLEPGVITSVDIDMLVYANFFKPGHRIRIAISSSDAPTYDRNLNTGGDNSRETKGVIAHVAIHSAPDAPSFIELPVISPV